MPKILHAGIEASLTKRGRYYQVAWRDGDDRYRKSTGCSDLTEAHEMACALIERQASRQAQVSTSMRLSEALERIWREYWSGHSSGPQRRRMVEDAIEILEDPPVDQINYAAMETLQAHWRATGISGATVNRKLTAVTSVLNRAVRHWEVLQKAPRTPREKERECRPRVLSLDEQKELIQCSSTDHWRWIWRFMLYTGCRRGELLHIAETSKWSAFDWTADPAKVQFVGKGTATIAKTIRSVPLRQDLSDYLQKRQQEGHKTPFEATVMTMRTEWMRCKKAMGLEHDEDFVIHALRHTCATDRIKEGMPVKLVQRWLGHRSWKTTERYINLIDSDLDRWVGHGTV